MPERSLDYDHISAKTICFIGSSIVNSHKSKT